MSARRHRGLVVLFALAVTVVVLPNAIAFLAPLAVGATTQGGPEAAEAIRPVFALNRAIVAALHVPMLAAALLVARGAFIEGAGTWGRSAALSLVAAEIVAAVVGWVVAALEASSTMTPVLSLVREVASDLVMLLLAVATAEVASARVRAAVAAALFLVFDAITLFAVPTSPDVLVSLGGACSAGLALLSGWALLGDALRRARPRPE